MSRLKLAWHVLRGRPLMYRMNLVGGINVASTSNVKIVNNSVTDAAGLTLLHYDRMQHAKRGKS